MDVAQVELCVGLKFELDFRVHTVCIAGFLNIKKVWTSNFEEQT